jgi:hypothetical protein
MHDVVVVVGAGVVVDVVTVGGGGRDGGGAGGGAAGAVVVVELLDAVGDDAGVGEGPWLGIVRTDALVAKPCPAGAVGSVSWGALVVVVVAVKALERTGMVTGV